MRELRFNGFRLGEEGFAFPRNSDREEDEKIDQEYYDEQQLTLNAATASRRLQSVVNRLKLAQDGLVEMLRYASNPEVSSEEFKTYVQGAAIRMAEEMFHTAIHTINITRLLPAKQFCKTMGINARKGTMPPTVTKS